MARTARRTAQEIRPATLRPSRKIPANSRIKNNSFDGNPK
jgi:hypothetical protein